MSKNILFRGQTRKKGEKVTMSGTPIPSNWVFGGIFPQNNGGDFAIIYQQDPEIQKFPVYAETVCQYTGKNDKYGGKIFENDIMTFGLGCNHGGSALMIEDYYNSNIPSSRYYAANQREEAIAKAKEIALNRGDTESIHSIETAPLIHVYDDRFVTKNPQSWKAPGDEFCNTLEEITETAGDALAAGLLVICATAKSVKRG